MNIRNCWFGERQNRKKGIKTPGQEHRYVVLVFSNLCLQSTPTSYLGTWGLGELGQRQISRLVAEWKCETGQEKQTCLASLKEVTLFFFMPEECMGRTKPLSVPLDPEAAGAMAQPVLCCWGISTDLQHWQVMSQRCFCSFILGENQLNEQGCVCLSSVPHIKAFLLWHGVRRWKA